MKKNIALKPCPFCGSSSIKLESETNSNLAYAFCKECVSIGPSADNMFEAAYNWNNRENLSPPFDYLLNIRQVCQCLGLSRATIYRLIQKGMFPKPVRPMGTNAARWTIKNLEQYQEQSSCILSQKLAAHNS